MSPLLTFHRILPACEAGSREGWQAFLESYTRVVFELLRNYLAEAGEDRHREIWREALGALAADNFASLRTLNHQAEREFLVDLRTFLFDVSLPHLEAARDIEGAPRPTVETLTALSKGLPLLHQEIIVLKLAGYSNLTLEKMLRITPAVAKSALERLETNYPAVLQRPNDACLWPPAWFEALRNLRALKKDGCPPLHLFLKILDGQTTWYEKSPAEEHRVNCLHCLERWTALAEVTFWRREAKPFSATELDSFLSCLPLQGEGARRKSFLKRFFAKFGD